MLSLLVPISSNREDISLINLSKPLKPLQLHILPSIEYKQSKRMYWQQATGIGFTIGQYCYTDRKLRTVRCEAPALCAVLYYCLQGNIYIQAPRLPKIIIPAGQYCLLVFPMKTTVRIHLAVGYHHAVQLGFSISLLKRFSDAPIVCDDLFQNTAAFQSSLPALPITRGILSIWNHFLLDSSTIPQFCFFRLNEGCLKLLYQFVRSGSVFWQQQHWKHRKGIRAEELESYLTNHLDIEGRPLATEKMCARKIGMSTHQFRKFWKERTGLTLSRFLLQLRMETARQLLLSKKETPATIFLRVGYQDFSSFSRAFSTWFGFPPSKVKDIYIK